jgi:glycosyltransferase involved in cell wall biosynthesis
MVWHILTGEFPPEIGGVGDYTAHLAAALEAAGDTVIVWSPGRTLPDRFGRASRAMLQAALVSTPGTVLLQYVPNALGSRGMNVAFCWWLRAIAKRGVDVRVMFHEPYFYFGVDRPWRNALAVVQRGMAAILMRSATTAYVSTETWRRCLEPLGPAPIEVLPIPSNVDASRSSDRDWRSIIAPGGEPVVGHFGTYGDHVTAELLRVVPEVAARTSCARLAFIGRGSREFVARLDASHPEVADRSWASGLLAREEIATVLRACDVLIQPYPDGITTRRTTAMAGLSVGVPVVTTVGELTEPVWVQSRAAVLIPVGDASAFAGAVASLLEETAAREAQAGRGAQVYGELFSLEHTIARLRGTAAAAL